MSVNTILIPSKVVYRSTGIVSSGLQMCLNLGHALCIDIPKRGIAIFFSTQKELILLPFHLFAKIYETFFKNPVEGLVIFYDRLSKPPPSVLEIFTGEKYPSSETIIESAKAIRCAAMKTIRRETESKCTFLGYKEQLLKWRLENKKKIEEAFKITVEEKELMKSVASVMRYLKALRIRREKLDAAFNDSIMTMIKTKAISTNSLLVMQDKIRKVDDAIREKTYVCLNMLGKGKAIYDIADKPTRCKQKSKEEQVLDLQQLSKPEGLENILKALSSVADENIFLKNRLDGTQEKLEEIIRLFEYINRDVLKMAVKFEEMTNLNKEVLRLQVQLTEDREMFLAVEAERNLMKDKLLVLEKMIKDEEDFLSESGYEETDVSFSDEQDDLPMYI